ncbi:MAG TPA: hypothetical protein VN918_09925 [Myxococcaceae bacterium]|nr:hypothetical protein [Myxococcaceae bacterium]
MALLVLMPLAACDKPRGNSPVDAYTSFSKAAQRGDYKTAYAAFSQQTQKRLATKSKEISSASGGAIKDDPAALAFSGTTRPEPLTEVKLVREDADRCVLAAVAGGSTDQVTMVREQEGWKVDLTEKMGTTKS